MASQEDTACAVPKCKADGAVKFRGKWMCDAHWLRVADVGDKHGDLAEESQLARWGFDARKRRQ